MAVPAPSLAQIKRYVKGLWATWKWRREGLNCSGRVVVVGLMPKFWSRGQVIFGDRINFRSIDYRIALTIRPHAKLSIGDKCSINEGVEIDVWESVEIGPYCRIGTDCRIADTSYHETDEGAGPVIEGITIGRNVWIASNVQIMPGVTIGDHSVVGSGAIVTKSFPDRSLIAGSPARKLRDINASDGYIRP